MPLKDLFNKSDTKDYDAAVVRDMPTYPGLTLTYHVLLKNVQAGATIGSIVACGMWLKQRPERKLPALLLNQWPRYAGFGGAAGILTGSAMMLYKMRTIEADGVEDRAYRIILNKGVQTMDFYSEIGGITCLLLGLSRGRFGGGGGGGGGVAAGAKKIRYPWFLMAQGIAAGSVGYLLGSAVGLPLQKPLELLGFRGFHD